MTLGLFGAAEVAVGRKEDAHDLYLDPIRVGLRVVRHDYRLVLRIIRAGKQLIAVAVEPDFLHGQLALGPLVPGAFDNNELAAFDFAIKRVLP